MTPQEYHLQHKYGITLQQYNQLRRKQKYRCGVCLRSEKEFKQRLCVDHDHKTLEIRGLLCTHCNRYVIGRHRDPQLFLSAHAYLIKGTGWFVPQRRTRKRRKRR